MSDPIIIKTPQPDTEERLVLVPPDAVSRAEGGVERLIIIRTAYARDATPADLERAGFVREMVEPTGPGTLAHLRNDLRDAVKRAEHAEREAESHRQDLDVEIKGRIALRQELGAHDYEGFPDFVRRLVAERDTLRAEVARLTAPASEGSCWACREDLGVAHERARQQQDAALLEASDEAVDADLRAAGVDPEALAARGLAFVRECQARRTATEDELKAVFLGAYPAPSSISLVLGPGVRAVAARVRQEQCLVAQAVGMGCSVRVEETPRNYGASFDGWTVIVSTRGDPGVTFDATHVPAADVPATLARLLGEVSR